MAEQVPEIAPDGPRNARHRSVLRGAIGSRPFRLLWIGQGTSLLGDQFSFIALPWLVLQLTPDPAALGLVLALAGVPRAIFMLIGGAAADRFSPRTVMLASDIVRFVLTVVMSALTFTGFMNLRMLYGFVFLFGLFSGLFLPASSSIIPRLVRSESLAPANALFQGTAQITVFLGPVLAGGLIAWIGNSLLGYASGGTAAAAVGDGGPETAGGLVGIAVALAFDALTFLVSIATLWAMGKNVPEAAEARTAPGAAAGATALPSELDGPATASPVQAPAGSNAAATGGVFAVVAEGFRYVGKDPFLRGVLIIVAAINFMFVGPLFVGIPFLAKTRFPEGAAAFGLIMSGYGGGNLLGYLLSGALTRVPKSGWLFLGVIGLFGIGTIALGFLSTTWIAFAILFVMGVGNGFVSIAFVTQLQLQTSKELIGRVMSLLMFAGVGLVPVSQALSGTVLRFGSAPLFVVAGLSLIATSIVSAGNVHIRKKVF